MTPRDPDRRQFLKLGSVAVASIPLHALAACSSVSTYSSSSAPVQRAAHPQYGPLVPIADDATGLPLLWLPEGFRYRSFGWTGDLLNDGTPTPPLHDGMAALDAGNGRVRLIRNHELRTGRSFSPDSTYDPGAGAGTTTVELEADTCEVTAAWASLSGTAVNCAGGPTPWGSWLSCEETVGEPDRDNTLERKHGYIFEVPLEGGSIAEPLRSMGRFRHEAVAVDPSTSIVYETEDQGDRSGFYRFLPNEPGRLAAGGRLQMLCLSETEEPDMRTGQVVGRWRGVHWVDIGDPDPEECGPHSVSDQGRDHRAARFTRLEGAWYGAGRIVFVSTDGGNAEQGQVWEYDPQGDRLRLLFESPGANVVNMPDNICVSPRGGLLLCEDGVGPQFVHGLTVDGQVFQFARNNVVLAGERNEIEGDFRDREFAGATYSPDGRWLFFNVQAPGISFAVTGPWEAGAL